MRTEKNSRELRTRRWRIHEHPFGNALGPGPVGVGGCVARASTAATAAPGAGALRITAAPACYRRRVDEPDRSLGPGAAFRRLSPFGDPHRPARFHAGRPRIELRFARGGGNRRPPVATGTD